MPIILSTRRKSQFNVFTFRNGQLISIVVVLFICSVDKKAYPLQNVQNSPLFYFAIFQIILFIKVNTWKFCWVYACIIICLIFFTMTNCCKRSPTLNVYFDLHYLKVIDLHNDRRLHIRTITIISIVWSPYNLNAFHFNQIRQLIIA